MANSKPDTLLGKFKTKMRSLGFELIGSGKNAIVMKKSDEPSYVIKAWEMDVGYLLFLKLIAQHPQNKYFPKILKYDRLKHKDFPGLHFVKMEVLQEISVSAYQHIYEPYQRYMKYKDDTRFAGDLLQGIKDKYEEQKENNEGFYGALDLVWNTPLGTCQLDINPNNIMKRPDGCWVITDPFVSFDGD